MKLGIGTRVVVMGVGQILVVVGSLFCAYYVNAYEMQVKAHVDKARAIVLTAEGCRQAETANWNQGAHSIERMSEWARSGEIDRILGAVPIVTAFRAASSNAREGGYQFRMPALQPRNSSNAPDEWERGVLETFQREHLDEVVALDKKMCIRDSISSSRGALARRWAAD